MAFPPYISTDADTADPWTLENRIGFFDLERDKKENAYASPLYRFNLGIPHHLEIVTEFENRPDLKQMGKANVGFKWIPLAGSWSAGIETLAHLPVKEHGGPGMEGSVLLTVPKDNLRLHVNAGGFTDNGPVERESGWMTGAIMETYFGRFRPGLEFFAKQTAFEPVQASIDPGLIVDFGLFDARMGTRFGLTDAAPTLAGTLWVTFKLPVR
ncbi:MAG: hypothetical protein HY579_00645 [Nitrospinae bacterium]|nr:hypothetical protein [Nitrospinota bacterium]